MLLIRAATVSDVPLLLRFFRELAEYERQPKPGRQVTTSPGMCERHRP